MNGVKGNNINKFNKLNTNCLIERIIIIARVDEVVDSNQ